MGPRARQDPIADFLAARVAEGRLPGASWWVEGPGGVPSHGSVGWAALEPRRRPAAETLPYDLASLTKPLATASLLALLEQEGTLDLEAPAEAYLPELHGSFCGSASLLALAEHASGLAAWRPLYLRAATLEGYLEQIAAEPPAVPRGETLYSDLGYVLLGAVLERAGGQGLGYLFDERIARPLGLRRTGFPGPGRGFADAAPTERGSAYERSLAGGAGEAVRPWRETIPQGQVHDGNAHGLGGEAGHAGLFGVVGEVAALARELLRPERLPLGERARRRLLEGSGGSRFRTLGLVTAAGSGAARGLLPDAAPGHTGFTGTSVWIDPAAGRLFVLLSNRVHPEVPSQDFQPVRRGFHRIAVAQLRSAGPAARGNRAN